MEGKRTMRVKQFFYYMFRERNAPTSLPIDEVVPTEPKRQTSRKLTKTERYKMWRFSNWLLAIVCISSLGVLSYYAIFLPQAETPDSLGNAFTLTLGYFGGAYASFAE